MLNFVQCLCVMNYILFDPIGREALYPISATRPVANIRWGMKTIQQKWEILLGTGVSVLVPPFLSQKFTVNYQLNNTYINGSVVPDSNLIEAIGHLKKGQKLVKGSVVIAFYSERVDFGSCESLAGEEVEYQGDIVVLKNTWDLISELKAMLITDFSDLSSFQKLNDIENITAVKRENIFIGHKVKLGVCILNASDGPIVIDDEAEIMDGAIIKGPVYIGKHTVIKMAAKIYGPASFGEHCRVGGEVTDSIFQAYSNKGHDGFLGHSYLGEWCNLGADTNNSNLKNNYEPVRIWNYETGRFDRTGLQFLGVIMGDHAKTGINTMLNSGTVVGVATNIYGGGFHKNFVPDFTTGEPLKLKEYPLKQVSRMAASMMNRRNVPFSKTEEKILVDLFDKTSKYRK